MILFCLRLAESVSLEKTRKFLEVRLEGDRSRRQGWELSKKGFTKGKE